MEIETYNFQNGLNWEVPTSKMSLHKVFADQSDRYLNAFNLFIEYFNSIPNSIHEINIDCKKANEWFHTCYESEISNSFYSKRYYHGNKSAELDDVFYFLDDDLIINLDFSSDSVRFLYQKTDILKVEKIILQVKKFKKRKNRSKPEISVLMNTNEGLDTSSLFLTKPKLSIEDNYDTDFSEVHKIILKRLAKPNDKGIVLLHGKPGTGKTSYLRYLISTLKKEVIFLPPNMAASITNPDLFPILVNNPNSVFVIEDAENIIVDREKNGSSAVSALLNISDGLLSDCLNIQIICTFNTDITKVDSALMRKGRLIAQYEFKELEVDKANALSKKLGFETKFTSPITLAGIYNQNEKDFLGTKKVNTIGF